MRAIEFKTKIKDKQIQIPPGIQSELEINQDKTIRVIVLFEDQETDENFLFQESAGNQFLKGYTESDSIYDNYKI